MKTILVVDDEFGISEVLSMALEDEGYRVCTAANGLRGLEMIREVRPDLLVVDFMMPLMDGPSMARKVREDADAASLPIVLMSALPEAAVRSRFADYQGFFQKPFRINEFLAVVARLLRGG